MLDSLNVPDDAQHLPAAFDVDAYRSLWPDLNDIPTDRLQEHYTTHGIGEGRLANSLANRRDFIALVPPTAKALEIGPFCHPVLNSPNTMYFDVLTQTELQDRARLLGNSDAIAPHIHFVSPKGDLSVVPAGFDAVLSSHCLEHQPDLIAHLQQVARILQVGGRYFVLVPDKRFCFDAHIAASSLADVIDAHRNSQGTHTLRSVIEHRAMTTHNDAARHWQGDHGNIAANVATRTLNAIQEFDAAHGCYIDVHAWQFTPESASELIAFLYETNFTKFTVERLYPTLKGNNEFWMVLRREA